MFCLFRDWDILFPYCSLSFRWCWGPWDRHAYISWLSGPHSDAALPNLTPRTILLPYRDSALGKASYSPFVLLLRYGYASPVPHSSLSLASCHIIPVDDDGHYVNVSLFPI